MNRLLALAVLFSFQLHAAVPIAPLDPIRGPVAHTDTDAVSTTNGDSTLTVWSNFQNPYAEGTTIWARLLDADDDRDAFVVARGHGQRVATNGTDYLITYATTVSRFSAHFRPTIMARVVHAGGTLGDSIYIHHSTQVYPNMRGVAWSGSKWMIAFGDPEPMVAVVSADLHDVRIVELAGSSIRQLVNVGGRTFAVRSVDDRLEAIEIREDATIGVTYSIAGADGKIVATSANAATVFFATGAASFTAEHGFGTPSAFANALDVVDAIATADGGALLLHYDAAAKVLAVTEFAGATAGKTTTVLTGIGPITTRASARRKTVPFCITPSRPTSPCNSTMTSTHTRSRRRGLTRSTKAR